MFVRHVLAWCTCRLRRWPWGAEYLHASTKCLTAGYRNQTHRVSPSNMEKLRIWQICAVFFALTTLALIVAVAVISSKDEPAKETKTCSSGSSAQSSSYTASSENTGVFDDLTEKELIAVRDYMLNHQQLNITPFNRLVSDKICIFGNGILALSRQCLKHFLPFFDSHILNCKLGW